MKSPLLVIVFLLIAFESKCQFRTLTSHNGYIMDMEVYKGDLYVIGSFDTIGGIRADKIAKYDGIQWSALPIYLVDYINTFTYTLKVYKDELYIAAVTSDTISEPLRNEYITKWDGANWSVLQDSSIYRICPVFCNGIYDLEIHDSLLYISGEFSGTPSNPSFHGLGAWDGSEWVLPLDTSQFGSGIGLVWDIESNNQGLWFMNAGGLTLWDGVQRVNYNHPYPFSNQRNIIAGTNFIYANNYANFGNSWSNIALKGPWDDHMFIGSDLFFTRAGILFKMDTANQQITKIDSINALSHQTSCRFTFYRGSLIMGLILGRDSNGTFLYSIDSARVLSEIQSDLDIINEIYPNPAKDHLFINSTEHIQSITISNMNGLSLLEESFGEAKFAVDITSLSSGFYLLQIQMKNGTQKVQKFIVQH